MRMQSQVVLIVLHSILSLRDTSDIISQQFAVCEKWS